MLSSKLETINQLKYKLQDLKVQEMLKINFSQIFETDTAQDQNLNKLLETEAGSLTHLQDSIDTMSIENKYNNQAKDQIFIEDTSVENHQPVYKRQSLYHHEQKKKQYQIPGVRLYYDHTHRLKDCEKKHLQKSLEEDNSQCFKPKLNNHSLALLKRKSHHKSYDHITQYAILQALMKEQTLDYKQKFHKNNETSVRNFSSHEQLSSLEIKQLKERHQCTFSPALISKSSLSRESASPRNQSTLRESLQRSMPNIHIDNQQIPRFQHLYNNFKVNQYRKRMNHQLEEKSKKQNQRVLSKRKLDNFLERNNKFIQKKNKKNQLLTKFSHSFDLESGSEFFKPKLNDRRNQRLIEMNKLKQTEYTDLTIPNHRVNPQQSCENEYKMFTKKINFDKIQEHQGQYQFDHVINDNEQY